MAASSRLPQKPAKAKKPPRDPKKFYPGDLSPETQDEVDRRLIAEHYRTYLRAWFADAVHLISHLRDEARDLAKAARVEPDGDIAVMGADQFELYSSALDHAHAALSEMLPPARDRSIFLMNVAERLDTLRREKPWKGRDV